MDELTTRKRLVFLFSQNLERTKGNYIKKDAYYWSEGKRQSYAKKRKLIEMEIEEINHEFENCRQDEIPEINFSDMSIKDIKEKLKSLGVNTKLRKEAMK